LFVVKKKKILERESWSEARRWRKRWTGSKEGEEKSHLRFRRRRTSASSIPSLHLSLYFPPPAATMPSAENHSTAILATWAVSLLVMAVSVRV
jgi:hypothetical protein